MYEAINNIIPHIETRHTKIGEISYQIPIDVSADRRLGLALRWLISSAHKQREAKMWLNFHEKLSIAHWGKVHHTKYVKR